MRVAITGTTGRLGAALCASMSQRHEVIPLPRSICDLTDSEALKPALAALDCDVLLNPAGLTSIEACEDDSRQAMLVNSAAPGKLALWAAERGVRMIHFSTDYVFSGSLPGHRLEPEPTGPLNAYGRSKLAGERAVLAHPGNLVLRVSWLYGDRKASFVERIIGAALAGEALAAIADKWSIPSYLPDLAGWVETLLDKDVAGVLHACHGGDPVTWHQLAERVVLEMHACGALAECPPVQKQALDEQAQFRAARPRHTAMSSERLASLSGIMVRPWEQALEEYVRLRCR